MVRSSWQRAIAAEPTQSLPMLYVVVTWLYGSMGKSMRRGVEDGYDISTTKLMGKPEGRLGAFGGRRLLLVTMLANGEECLKI